MSLNCPVHCSTSPSNTLTRPNAALLRGSSSFSSSSSLSFSTSSLILSSFSPITHQRKRQMIRVLVLRASVPPVALDEAKEGHGNTASTGQKPTSTEFLRHKVPLSDRVLWSPNNNEEMYSVPSRYMKRLPWEVEQPFSNTRAPKSSHQRQHDSISQSYRGKAQQNGPPWPPRKLQDTASQGSLDLQQQDIASWSPRKQQDRASWTPPRQQDRGLWSPDNRKDRGSRSSQKRRFTGPGQYHTKDSFTPQGQQMHFQNYGVPKMQVKTAPRLQNRSSVFQQVAQPDRRNAFSRIGHQALSDQDQDEDDVFPVDLSFSRGLSKPAQGLMESGSSGNNDPQDRSLSTSKLEEILSRFMPNHLSGKGHNGEGKRNIIEPNRVPASEAKTAWRRDAAGSMDAKTLSRSTNTLPEEDLYLEGVKDIGRSLNAEDCNNDPSRDRTSAFGKRNVHALKSAPGRMFVSPSAAPGQTDTGRKVHTSYQNRAFIGSTHAAPTRSSSGTHRSSFFEGDSRSKSTYSEQQPMKGEVQRSCAEEFENPGFEWTDLESEDHDNKDDEDDDEDDAMNDFSIASDASTDIDVYAGEVSSIMSGVEGKADTYSTSTQDGRHSDQTALGGSRTCTSKVPSRKKVPTWHSHSIRGIPFEFQFSYSETPAAPVVRYREKPYSPFGPDTMERPWTGRAPLKPSKKKVPEFDSFKPPPRKKGVRYVQDPGPFHEGQHPKPAKSREEILGEPLTNQEIALLVDKCHNENRQLNLGRDGLTHNMLDLVHCHWKRRRVCKIRCLGVPTLDMDNVCFHLEDKTGGKIIYRTGGLVYLFRGRNYNYKDRPRIPIMLWKPATPVYPKLIQPAPGGLTKEEADSLREIGKKIEPMCSLVKNGVYLTLVNDVRDAFKIDPLVRIDCRGLNTSDYKKIGGKLKDLVPCVLLSFDDEQILMWKGQEKTADNGTPPEGVEAAEGSESEAIEPSDFSDARCLDAGIIEDAHGDDGQSSEVSSYYSGDRGAEYPQHLVASVSWSSNEEVEVMPRDSITHTGIAVNAINAINATNDAIIEEGYDLIENSREEDITLNSPSSEVNGEVGVAMVLGDRDEVQYTMTQSLCMDALWDDAITSGMAVELDLVHADSDLVAKKAGELALAVPVTHIYSLKLLNKLRIRKAKPTPNQERALNKELYKLHDLRRQKKQRKMLGRFRLPSVGTPQTEGGLAVEELARLLSVK